MIKLESLRLYLDKAERHAAHGREMIARQRALVARLRNDGHDTLLAESILRTMIETQALHENSVIKLAEELNGAKYAWSELPSATEPARPNAGNHLLRSLPNEDLALIQPFLETVGFRFRQRLQSAHRQTHTVHFPDSGMVSVVTVSPRGRHQALAGLIGREGMTGLEIVFGSDRSPFDIEVEVEGQGQSISLENLVSAMDQSPSLRAALKRYLQFIWIQLAYSALANAAGTIGERLARLLLTAQDRLESDEVPLTHEQLATMMAVRRASITATLQQFEASGLVARERGVITITDRAGLEQGANHLY
jgi:CRP-like cAMP-binding protein